MYTFLGLISTVSADTGDIENPQFGWSEYFVTIGIIIGVLILSLWGVTRFQSYPGSLPIKKLTIAAAITVIVNAILMAIVYLEV